MPRSNTSVSETVKAGFSGQEALHWRGIAITTRGGRSAEAYRCSWLAVSWFIRLHKGRLYGVKATTLLPLSFLCLHPLLSLQWHLNLQQTCAPRLCNYGPFLLTLIYFVPMDCDDTRDSLNVETSPSGAPAIAGTQHGHATVQVTHYCLYSRFDVTNCLCCASM